MNQFLWDCIVAWNCKFTGCITSIFNFVCTAV